MRELALVLRELLLEARDARRVAHHAGLRALAQHAAQAVDGGLERVDLEVEPLEGLRGRVPLPERLVLALREVGLGDGHDAEALLQRAALGPPAPDLAGEPALVDVVHALPEREARERHAVQERERLLLAGLELRERAHAVRRS